MALAVSLYSRPKSLPDYIRLLMDKIDGKITQAELERRVEEMGDRQLSLFKEGRHGTLHLQGEEQGRAL